jgi:hypothetical protein
MRPATCSSLVFDVGGSSPAGHATLRSDLPFSGMTGGDLYIDKVIVGGRR